MFLIGSEAMSFRNIMLLAVLGLLLAVCFLSDKIAPKFGEADEKKLAERSLLIKLAAAAVALIMYLVIFLS